MAKGYSAYDQRYVQAPANGYRVVYYDPKTDEYFQTNPNYSMWDRSQPQYIPIGGANSKILGKFGGQTTYTPSAVDFNTLPSQVPAGVQIYGAGTAAQPYQRPTAPTAPTAPTGMGYRPQFDPTFIQQMLAQRFGNNQGSGIPTAAKPSLTPAATQNYGGYQGQGGLGALRAIANPASTPASGGV